MRRRKLFGNVSDIFDFHADVFFFTQNPQKSQNLFDANVASHRDSYNSAYSACNINKVSFFFRFLFNSLRKETEIHFAIMPLFHEVRMFLEVLVFVVFQNEHAAFTQ